MGLLLVYLLLLGLTLALSVLMNILTLKASLTEVIFHSWESVGMEKTTILTGIVLTFFYTLYAGLRNKGGGS